jgi:hypothetical protein
MSGLNSDKLIFVLLSHFLENIVARFYAGLCAPRSADYLFHSWRDMSLHHLKFYNCIISSHFWSNSEKRSCNFTLCVSFATQSVAYSCRWIDVSDCWCVFWTCTTACCRLCENYCPLFVRHFSLTGLPVFLLLHILWSLKKHLYQPWVDDLLGEFLLVFYANCSTVTPDSLSWKSHIQNVFSEPDVILLYWWMQLY